MKIEWLRRLTLAGQAGDLLELTRELWQAEFGRPGRFLSYDAPGWRLLEGQQSCRLDEACLASRCALEGKTVSAHDQEGLLPWEPDASEAMAFPLIQHGTMVGVWLAPQGLAPESRSEAEELLETTALLLSGLRELDLTRCALVKFQELAVVATETVSDSEMGHTAQVCQLAADLGEFLDLSAQSRRRLWSAALYHDTGKVLLRESGSLDREMQHPEASAKFLQQTELYSDLAPLVAAHHRAYDAERPVTLEQGVLALAEDLVEFLKVQESLAFEASMAIFFQQNCRNHHPDVVDALAGLIDSGRLDRLRPVNSEG